jgi:dCMP deaminase
MRPDKHETFLQMAELVAARSTCGRLQVGCVLTDLRGEQVWIGYNGGYAGGPNTCRHPGEVGGCGCLHAELNAIIKADGPTKKVAYVSTSPCAMCAVALINAHVVEVYYSQAYRDTEGVDILREAGVEVHERPDS